jgi:hypothetical protein
MRERSRGVREAIDGAVRASPNAAFLKAAAKATGFALAVGVFLAFVGAFGSDVIPPGIRYAVFAAISLICVFLAWGVVTLVNGAPALEGRPWVRQVVIVAVLTPLTALVSWIVFGALFMGGPKLRHFPTFLLTSFGMTIAMSALSQAVFRLRKESDAAEATPDAAPARFAERLPLQFRNARLYAVEAEDHYVRAHTDRGSTLILMRLADAAAELEGLDGARVHRSWWVAKDAVAGVIRRGGQTRLKLADGSEAPVSRREAAELRRAGWF